MLSVFIPPGLMLNILVKLFDFLSIGPPMLPTVWKTAPEETLVVTIIIVGHQNLGHPDVLDTVHNLVAFRSSHSLSSLLLVESLLILLVLLS